MLSEQGLLPALYTWEIGCREAKHLVQVTQDTLEFRIANISLDNPSFMLAALYRASSSPSQLSESYKGARQA